jgi:hypothetical protein
MPLDNHPGLPSQQPPDARAARGTGPLVDMTTKRTLAKTGVLVALGLLVWSGMQRPRRRYMPLHTWTGVALIGLTLWHWSLYLPRAEKSARRPRPASTRGAPGLPPARAPEG